MNKRSFIRLAWILVLAFSPAFAQKQVVDKIAAVVDDEIILASEVNNYAYFEALNLKINPQTDTAAYNRITRKVLDALISQKILLAQAKLDSLVVDESQVDQSLDQQIQERTQQAGGEQALEKYLGKTIKEIRKMYRSNIRKQLLTQKIQSSRFQDIKVSRSEVEQFFATYKDSLPDVGESVNISHILMEVKPGEAAFEEARVKAAQLLDSIRQGSDFITLAKAHSTEPGADKRGGDLGWFNRSDFVKEFADAAVRLEPGEVSNVVRTQFGCHIIQMIAKSGEKIHVRHILIGVTTTTADKDSTLEKLKRLRQDILDQRIPFEDAALKYSDDPAKKGNLGNLGWIEIASFQDKSFMAACEKLGKGEFSDAFETGFGFHVIKVNDRRDRRQVNLRDDWQSIENMAMQRKQSRELERWLAQIRSKFFIDVRL